MKLTEKIKSFLQKLFRIRQSTTDNQKVVISSDRSTYSVEMWGVDPGIQKTSADLSDRSTYSMELWEAIANNTCPNCSKENTLYVKARGGLAMNVVCENCNSCYWTSEIREFGAKKIE